MTAATRVPRRLVFALAAAALALAIVVGFLLPPRRVSLPPLPRDSREIAGALHVHSTRSDGTGTVEEIAAAAADAGLRFVILADHGDATRAPDPPRYVSGVLCIDGVEIGTTAGHYVAVGLTRPAPYPLGGEPRDVVEDVERLGGFGIAAHPGSPRRELRWREWSAPVTALEWLNADSEWRDESPTSIARALMTYFVRPPEVIASLFDRPAALERWDAMSRRRRLIALSGHDAHARIGVEGEAEPRTGGYSLRVPSYASVFRAFSQRVRVERPLTGAAAGDAQLVLAALRAGHTYTAIDAYASPGRLDFQAEGPGARGSGGDEIATTGPVRLSARVSSAPGITLVLIRNGRVVATQHGPSLTYDHAPSGDETSVYRVEARLESQGRVASVPWMLSNPIWIHHTAERETVRIVPPPAAVVRRIFDGREYGRFALEKDRESTASAELAPPPWGGPALRLKYQLAEGVPRGQYAAAVMALDPASLPEWDRVRFRAAASPETRVSVQARDDRDGRRWRRSVVVGADMQEIVVRLDDMSFAEPRLGGRPPRGELRSLLFVVDTTHTRPGTSGVVWIDDVQLEAEKKGPAEVRGAASRSRR